MREKPLKKTKNIYYKNVLEFNFVIINCLEGSILSKISKNHFTLVYSMPTCLLPVCFGVYIAAYCLSMWGVYPAVIRPPPL